MCKRELDNNRLLVYTVFICFNRFEFLQPWHQYNAYYEFKKQFFLQKESSDNSQVCVCLYVHMLKMQRKWEKDLFSVLSLLS